MKKRYLIAGIFTGLILQLTHHIWLGSHGDKHFDLMVMLIILICGFLLGLKLTSYLADFKNIKHKSRIEIVFLAVFFIFLVIPVLNINQSEKSVRENRMLATYQPLIQKDRINAKYGKDFENYYNDRFYLRYKLISNYHLFRAILAFQYYETNDCLYIKNKKSIFCKTHLPRESVLRKKDISLISDSLNEFNSFCKKNNIKLYVIVVPNSSYVYQDFTKPFDNNSELKSINKNIAELISQTDAAIIYPLAELRDGAKDDWVYYKTDHHWTDTGAYIVYSSLMKKIRTNYPSISVISKKDYKIKHGKRVRANYERTYTDGHQLEFSGNYLKPLKKHILDTEYKFFEYKKPIEKSYINDLHEKSVITYNKSGANKRVLLIGNSMLYNFYPFIMGTFKSSKAMNLNEVTNKKASEHYKIMKYYKSDILKYNPDIIVLCVSTNVVKYLSHICEEE